MNPAIQLIDVTTSYENNVVFTRLSLQIEVGQFVGIVGPSEGSKAREVKVATEVALEQFLKDLDQI